MTNLPLDVLTWQATVASADGPKSSIMRLLLLALSARMLADDTGTLRMTGNELASVTRLSRRWAMQTAYLAVGEGWLKRERAAGWKQGWQAFQYTPALPNSEVSEHVERGTSPLAEARP